MPQYRVTDTRFVPVTDLDSTTYTFEVDVQVTGNEYTYSSYTVEIRNVSDEALDWASELWVLVHSYLPPSPHNPLAMRASSIESELSLGSYPIGVEMFAVGHVLQVFAQQQALQTPAKE